MRAASLAGALVLTCTLSACNLSADATGKPPSAPSGAHHGGVLKVGITAPGGISPLDAYEPAGKLVSSALCDTVVSLDPVTGQVREALARGWVLSDGVGMTIKLRHGVRFSNGDELRARDVNYSLQQLIATSNGNYSAGLGKQFLALGAGKQQDILADPDKAAEVAQGVSRYDFQLTTLPLNGGALRTFAEPALAPIDMAVHTKDPAAFSRNPVCVGPYQLEKPYTSGDHEIRLKRSKSYYGQNVGYTNGGTGYADEIVFTIYSSAAAALTAYDRGQVDVVQLPQGSVAGTKDVASRVYGPATGVEYLGLPGGSTTPFADSDVRIALSEAIDRKALAASVFGPSAEPATGFEPSALAITEGPSLKGKDTKGAPLQSCGSSTPETPDLTAAKATLAAAASKPGAVPLKGFTLEVNNDGPYPAMARNLAAQWRSGLGLNVKVVAEDWDAYSAKATGTTGFTNPFRVRWSTDATAPQPSYNNEQSFLGPLGSEAGANVANWAHFSDRTFEFGLAQTGASATEVPARGAEFGRLAKILCQDMPMIPLAFERPTFLVRSTALGSARTVPVGRDGVLLLRELYLR